MRHAATWLVMFFAIGCGGEPVGSKVPRANPSDVAVGAAAAAAAMTLANPQAAARKPEGQTKEQKLRAVKTTKETVPSSVLDRADSDAKQPCGQSAAAAGGAPKPGDPGHLDLVPAPENPERSSPAHPTKPCPSDDDDDDGAGDE